MPVTATASLHSPAIDEPRAELLDLVSARFSPSDPINAITSVTATFDGVSKTVTIVSVVGGVKDCSFPATFLLEREHEVEWTVTTADANVNLETYTFTVRDADWGPERVESYITDTGWSVEGVGLAVDERVGGYTEKVEVAVLSNLTSTVERVELSVIEGLGAGYYSLERVDLIVAVLEEYLACGISVEVGTQDDPTTLPMSLEVEDDDIENAVGMSIEVYSEEYGPALGVSIDVSLPETNSLAMALEVGESEESELPLSVETEGSTVAPVTVEIRLTNEDLALAEESMSASEADA